MTTPIRVQFKDIKRLRKAYDPKLINKAERSANVKTSRKARTLVSKVVRSRYAIKAGRLSKGVTLKTFDKGDLTQSVLNYVGRRVGLINFVTKSRATPSANRTPAGKQRKVTVRVRKGGSRKALRTAFVGVGRSGNVHVFARTGAERFPLKTLKTISVPEMVAAGDTQRQVSEFVGQEHPAQFDNELRFFLNKATGR